MVTGGHCVFLANMQPSTKFSLFFATFAPFSNSYMKKYLAALGNIWRFFRRNPEDDRKWTEKLRDKYRLVVMNDETFEEISSFKLTPLSVYTILSSLVVGTAILVTLLIVYTPLKRYIPGYGDFQRDSEIAALTKKVGGVESELEATRNYAENLRNIMNGNVQDMTKSAVEARDKAAQTPDDSTAEGGNVGRIPEDEKLRGAVATGSFTGSSTGSTAPSSNAVGLRDLPLEQMFFMPPVSGEVTAKFDMNKDHFGIDVAAAQNTAIKAAADGTVVTAGFTVETGYTIAIQHPNNVVTMYKHNSVLLKKTGSTVKMGEAIAIVGNTGEASTGPHLHFELWYKGRPVNPADYLHF
jgi:murein DD-endopeptidase MepM/ murein hydrolase activator NlpD